MLQTDYYGICIQKMQYLGYAKSTQNTYGHYIKEFLKTISKAPTKLNADDFKSYLLKYNFTSISTQNQVINALRFLYKHGLKRKYAKVNFERPRKERKLPQAIDKGYLLECIGKIENKKHKAIISLAFSVGLRVSEVINLKLKDIDSKRMLIRIEQSKGKKDRYVPLSSVLLETLRDYARDFKPKEYVFNGKGKTLKYSSSSCNNLVKKYIGKEYHFHQLRHSSFTAMMESGTDTRIIQKIAGHSSIKTTQVYTHVSNFTLAKVETPI